MVLGKRVNLAEEQTLKKIKVKPGVSTAVNNILLERDKRQREREKRQALYTSICLSIISVFLFGLGISLIVVGDHNDIRDLLLLGSIFLVSGVGFLIFLLVLVCKPVIKWWNNRVTPVYENDQYINDVIPIEDVKKQRRPTAIQLYGEDRIIHVPNPKDLSDPEFPPPPMVCHPNNQVDDNAPVIQLPLIESEPHDVASS